MDIWKQHRGLMLGLVGTVVIGAILRFLYLDQKLFWHDEVFSIVRAAGYKGSELMSTLYTGQVIRAADLQAFQQFSPERGIADLFSSFITEDTQHPPLFYTTFHFWAKAWGGSIASLRSLAAIFSVMALPALFWLCVELFAMPLLGWIAMALMAVSPYHLLFAQEARQYSLWLLLTLLSTAALVRALRLKTWQAWAGYAVALALSFYTFLFSLGLAISHGLAVLIAATERRVFRAWGVALGASLLLFSPWLWLVIVRLETIQGGTSWTQSEIDPWTRFAIWGENISQLFVDFGWSEPAWLMNLIYVLFVLGTVYALWILRQRASKPAWWILLLLVGVLPICLVIPDVVGGGMRSVIERYFVPTYAGLGIVWAHLLATQIMQTKGKIQRAWQAGTALLLIGGLISCLTLLPASFSWNKGMGAHYPAMAAYINQTPQPLLVSSNTSMLVGNLLALSRYLEPEVKLELVVEPDLPDLPEGFSHIFLLEPSQALRSGILAQNQVQIEPVGESYWALEAVTPTNTPAIP